MSTSNTEDRTLLVVCPDCGNTLGRRVRELVVSQHRGRIWAGQPEGITCELCGAIWRPPDKDQVAA